jgi:carbon-monoxide dehydrogenase large subunit
MKSGVYPEDAAVLWAARRLKRPVTWTSTRVEALQADEHAREMKIVTELGFDGSKISAFRVRVDHITGAYLSERSLYPLNNIGGIAGVYRIPNIYCEIFGHMTNTVPTGPYRGAGRPEATFMIERTLDIAARELGLDPFKFRYRNLIPAKAMPFKTAFVFTYDVGEFAGNMDEAAKLADLENFPARRREAKKRGKLRGIGLCNPIEVAAGPFLKPGRDLASVSIRPDGGIVLTTGAISTGQGLETAFSQLVADSFGVPIDKVEYRQGDTDLAPYGRGSGGSAATSVGGTAVSLAVNAAIERATDVAADALEVSRADVEFGNGRFTVAGTDSSIGLGEVARKAEEAGRPLRESGEFQPEKVNFPNGCHICEVEVDPETGRVSVISYCAVEDVGRVLNAALLQGQIHGGVAQGIGQAIGEQIVYDADSGQLLTASFMDYAMPRAALMPQIKLLSREIPTATNALGVKGVGEAGAVGALAATINAVCDALSPLGVRHLDMPATPARVWSAIQAAKGK